MDLPGSYPLSTPRYQGDGLDRLTVELNEKGISLAHDCPRFTEPEFEETSLEVEET